MTRSLEIVRPVLPIPTTSKRILKRVTLPEIVAVGAGGERIAWESSALPAVLSMVLVGVKLLPPAKGRPPWSNSTADRIFVFQETVISKPLITVVEFWINTTSAVKPPPREGAAQQPGPIATVGLSETRG